ncbi:hypothetical protein CDD81_7474 [Ophiocordyceps australis]|uniref:Glycosyl transferase CAP10 domain-containing protein n=1 Tax=Ophiocordyceps australis TaxID=1399860 RepID=A0A2C5XBR7_9HYPO|nr:hypothetical protein CDD81_7474 [Ophiocordyceps australis]
MGPKLLYLVLGISSLVACYDIGRHSLCLPRELHNSTKLVEQEYSFWGEEKRKFTNLTLVSLADALGWTQQEPWMELLAQAAETWNYQSPEIAAGFRNVSAVSMAKWQVTILSRTIHRNQRCLMPMDPKKPQKDRPRQSMDFFYWPGGKGWAFSQWDTPHELVADCYQPRLYKQQDLYWPFYEMGSFRMLNRTLSRIKPESPEFDFWTSLRKVMDGDWKCGEYECGDFAKGSAWVPHEAYSLRRNLLETLGTRNSFCFVWNWKRFNIFKTLYYIDVSTPMSAQEKTALRQAAETRNSVNSQKFLENYYKQEKEHWEGFWRRVHGNKTSHYSNTTAKAGN